MKESMMMSLVSARTQMNKLILIIPLFFITMCGEAPVTPPANAGIPQEDMDMIMKALEYAKEYNVLQNRTEPDDAINSALENFWENKDGSNGSTESEELLQLSSDGD